MIESREGPLALLVLHKLSHDLRLYDVASGRELARVPTRRHPHEMHVDRSRGQALVTEYGLRGVESEGQGGNTVGVYSLRPLARSATISTGIYDRPHGVVADANGRLFVTAEAAGVLLIIDRASGVIRHAVETGQHTPHMTAVAPDGRTAFTANIGSGTLTAIDAESGAIVAQIDVLRRPEGMVFSPDGRWLYVVNRESRAVAIVATATHRMIGMIPTGEGPVRIVITPDGRRLAFPLFHADAVQVADTASGTVTATIPVGRQPAGTALSPGGTLLFVSCELEQRVHVVSLDSMRVVGTIATGEGPDAMACVPAAAMLTS